jgi:hypothetical protein
MEWEVRISLDHAWHLGFLTTLFQLHRLHCAEPDFKITMNGTVKGSVEGSVQKSAWRNRETGTLGAIRNCTAPTLYQV